MGRWWKSAAGRRWATTPQPWARLRAHWNQFDGDVQLVFSREEATHGSLALHFERGGRYALGDAGAFPLPRALARFPEDRLQVAVVQDGMEVERSDAVTLVFRESGSDMDVRPDSCEYALRVRMWYC